jgi:hypothetical protein
MVKVIYKDSKDGNKEKEKIFANETQANGFIIVSWHEYGCYGHKKIFVENGK